MNQKFYLLIRCLMNQSYKLRLCQPDHGGERAEKANEAIEEQLVGFQVQTQ
ncbi:hypothetical protein OS493_035231 [Desmophyllum pertusum]|uniref:Uncharacterized protein n=1 Tax=Desmophyllum pertusum TaxID=174260 RepID=A0A9W9ZJB3_9CNID|nr:hypothetical protein OS493_035231 [Desmophyllum pertusum]